MSRPSPEHRTRGRAWLAGGLAGSVALLSVAAGCGSGTISTPTTALQLIPEPPTDVPAAAQLPQRFRGILATSPHEITGVDRPAAVAGVERLSGKRTFDTWLVRLTTESICFVAQGPTERRDGTYAASCQDPERLGRDGLIGTVVDEHGERTTLGVAPARQTSLAMVGSSDLDRPPLFTRRLHRLQAFRFDFTRRYRFAIFQR